MCTRARAFFFLGSALGWSYSLVARATHQGLCGPFPCGLISMWSALLPPAPPGGFPGPRRLQCNTTPRFT